MTDEKTIKDDNEVGLSGKNDGQPAETVGQMLRRVRLEKQADIRDIAAYLCIRSQFLEDLENDDVANFPGETYVSGFLRSYASYLGLDPNATDARFKNERLEKADNARKASIVEADAETMSPDGKIIVVAVVLSAAVLFAWKFYGEFANGSFENKEEPAKEQVFEPQNPYPVDNVVAVDDVYVDPQAPQTPVVEQSAEPEKQQTDTVEQTQDDVVETVQSEPEPTEESERASEPAPSETVVPVHTPRIYGEKNIDARVVLNATADTWVEVSRVNEDGEKEVILSRLLHKGDMYRFPNEDGLLLRTGNAGGFDVYVDGKKIKPFGPAGAKRSRILMDADRLLPPSAEEAE